MSRARAAFLGLLPPTTKPEFSLVREPWLKQNVLGETPIRPSSSSQTRLYHYSSYGSGYLRQAYSTDMAWGEDDYIAFKCYVRPLAIEGRVLLFSSKGSIRSGGFFVDSVDGRVGCGWYDTVQQREVSIRTNVPVLAIGKWHYVYVRKKFPVASLGSGCWEDSIFGQSPTLAKDMIVVREIADAAPSYLTPTWTQKVFTRAAPTASVGQPRECISFTTDLEYSVVGCTATGLVTPPATTFTGAVGGQITASAAVFPEDGASKLHSYCLWQWSSANAKALDGNVYRVQSAATASNLILNCGNITASAPAPDFSAYTALSTGGIFLGVRLIKSAGFDTAEHPDTGVYDIEAFGSHLSDDPETGIMPFYGEYSSFAWVVENEPTGANPDIFESGTVPSADDIYIGTDGFAGPLYSGSQWLGELAATSPHVHTAVDTGDHVYSDQETSTEPNEALEYELDQDASGSARAPVWEPVETPSAEDRIYSIGVAFYDPAQADITPLSNPGVDLVVNAPGDDLSNPAARTSFVLSSLPISPERRPGIQRWIYVSQPGGGERFLVAQVPDNTSTSIAIDKTLFEVSAGVPLETDNGPPPRCRFVEASQGVLAFGDVYGFRDLIVYSKPFFIGAVPYSRNIFQVPSGASEQITGMVDNNGRLLVFKRDAIYRAILRYGAVTYDQLTREVGCVSHASILTLQNRVYWVGEQGWYVYPGSGMPYWLSVKLETFFNNGIDQGAIGNISAALCRRRNQVVIAVREDGELYQDHRISTEFDSELSGAGAVNRLPAGHRFSRYEDPNASCIGSVRDRGGQTSRLVAGTEEGFVVWLDRDDTALVLLGPTATAWGDSSLTAGAGSTTTKVVLSGSPNVDVDLAGARGAKLRWGATEAIVLLAEAGALHLDRAVASAPANTTALTLGTRTRYWKTRWLDLGVPEARKRMRHIDVVHTKQASGTVTVNAYEDFGSTAEPVGTLDLTQGWSRIAIDKIQTRFVQFEFTSTNDFELTEIVLRVSDADPR